MDDGSWFTSQEIYQALVECGEKFGNDLPLLAKRILGSMNLEKKPIELNAASLYVENATKTCMHRKTRISK